MRRLLLLLPVLQSCGTATPPPLELARSLEDLAPEQKRALAEAETLYRAGDPAFDVRRDALAGDPGTAYWLTHLLVRDLAVIWATREVSDERMLQSALGQGAPEVDRILVHFDAMGASTVECLADVVRSPVYETRQVGIRLLGRVGSPALAALEKMSRDPDPKIRRLAAEALEEMELPLPEGGLVLLRALVADPDFTVRAAAVEGLAHGGIPGDAVLLRARLLQDPDEFVRVTAAAALLAYPDLATAEALVRYLERSIQRDDRRGVEAADGSLRRLAGRRRSADLATWKEWLRGVSDGAIRR